LAAFAASGKPDCPNELTAPDLTITPVPVSKASVMAMGYRFCNEPGGAWAFCPTLPNPFGICGTQKTGKLVSAGYNPPDRPPRSRHAEEPNHLNQERADAQPIVFAPP
jgi:hypothetical protein